MDRYLRVSLSEVRKDPGPFLFLPLFAQVRGRGFWEVGILQRFTPEGYRCAVSASGAPRTKHNLLWCRIRMHDLHEVLRGPALQRTRMRADPCRAYSPYLRGFSD